MKIQKALNASNVLFDMMDSTSKELGLSRNSYIETVCFMKMMEEAALKDEHVKVALEDVSVSKETTITGDYRNSLCGMPVTLSKKMLQLILNVNLLENIHLAATKQMSIYINTSTGREFLCLLAVGTYKGKDIEDYLIGSGVNYKTIGKMDRPSEEYFYLSRSQRFADNTKESAFFDLVNEKLYVAKGNAVLQLHFTEMPTFINALCKLNEVASTIGNIKQANSEKINLLDLTPEIVCNNELVIYTLNAKADSKNIFMEWLIVTMSKRISPIRFKYRGNNSALKSVSLAASSKEDIVGVLLGLTKREGYEFSELHLAEQFHDEAMKILSMLFNSNDFNQTKRWLMYNYNKRLEDSDWITYVKKKGSLNSSPELIGEMELIKSLRL